ncbi:MICOS complex subunit Mic13 [Trinorchestia longiramus]|nr:MICOS complex subunit Mic13 [Trinorchestia longiramus]
MGKLGKLLWFGARVGLAGGAVYALNEQRVWSSDTDTAAIRERLSQAVPPQVSEVTQQYIMPYVPSKDYFHLDVRQHWNSAVLFTFGFLSKLPEHTADAVQYTAALASQAFSAVTDAAPEEVTAQATSSPAPEPQDSAHNQECGNRRERAQVALARGLQHSPGTQLPRDV